MRFKLLLIFVFVFGSFSGQAQTIEYLQMIDAGTYKVQEIIDTAEAYFAGKEKGRGSGYKQFKRWEYNALRMVKADGYIATIEERLKELERWNAYLNTTAQNRMTLEDNWEELGPETWNATSGWNPGVGRLTGLSIEEGNPDHMIVGANTGGVWRTTDGAQTWAPLNDYFSNLSVYSVTIDPLNPNVYFFGSNNGKIFKSIDAGATWNLLATIGNSLVNKILINPTDTNVFFATSENSGIYRSSDGGVNWNKINSDNKGYDVEFKPGDFSVVYASGRGFHKSTDGGATFTTIGGFANGPKMIGVSEADANVVYVLEAKNSGEFDGFYTSTDSGDSFTKSNHGSLNYFGYSTTGNDDMGQAPRDMAIAVNPTDINEVHIAGILSWRSMDGGTSFTCTADWTPGGAASKNIGYCHADVDDLLFYGTTLYAVTDGGIFRAADTGNISTNYYEDLTDGLGIRQFYKIGVSQTPNVIVSGGSQDNGTSFYKESTGWKDWLGADGMETFIDKTNPDIFYGTSQYGSLYRSSNSGASYYNLSSPGGSGNWVTPFEQDPIVDNTIYTGYSKVYKSLNSGSTWTAISQSFGGNLDELKIAPSNNQIMYASKGPYIYRTDDGGATNWEHLPIPGGLINSIAIHPTNPNKVAVASSSANHVLVSEDGGATWIDYKKNLPNFSAFALIWDNNGKDGLYLGMDYGIFYIDDTFTDWQPYSNLLPNVMINEFDINKTTNTLYAGTYGRGLWASPLVQGTVGIDEVLSESSVSIYPNPATSEVTIALPKSMNAEIRIFNISGKLVVFEAQTLVKSKHNIDISLLSSGVYFVRINSEEGTATKKLVIN